MSITMLAHRPMTWSIFVAASAHTVKTAVDALPDVDGDHEAG